MFKDNNRFWLHCRYKHGTANGNIVCSFPFSLEPKGFSFLKTKRLELGFLSVANLCSLLVVSNASKLYRKMYRIFHEIENWSKWHRSSRLALFQSPFQSVRCILKAILQNTINIGLLWANQIARTYLVCCIQVVHSSVLQFSHWLYSATNGMCYSASDTIQNHLNCTTSKQIRTNSSEFEQIPMKWKSKHEWSETIMAIVNGIHRIQ